MIYFLASLPEYFFIVNLMIILLVSKHYLINVEVLILKFFWGTEAARIIGRRAAMSEETATDRPTDRPSIYITSRNNAMLETNKLAVFNLKTSVVEFDVPRTSHNASTPKLSAS